MRKFIRYLADISGVSKDIRRETVVEIGGKLVQDGYWFNKFKPGVFLLQTIGESLKKYDHWRIEEIRKELYQDLNIKE